MIILPLLFYTACRMEPLSPIHSCTALVHVLLLMHKKWQNLCTFFVSAAAARVPRVAISQASGQIYYRDKDLKFASEFFNRKGRKGKTAKGAKGVKHLTMICVSSFHLSRQLYERRTTKDEQRLSIPLPAALRKTNNERRTTPFHPTPGCFTKHELRKKNNVFPSHSWLFYERLKTKDKGRKTKDVPTTSKASAL